MAQNIRTFSIGTYAVNYLTSVDYEAFGVIRGILSDGSLILENPRLGRWVADPAKCRPYCPPAEA